MCQTLCVRAKTQPRGTTWGAQRAEKMPGCWSAVRADSGTALLPVLGLGDFTLAHAQKAPVLLTEGQNSSGSPLQSCCSPHLKQMSETHPPSSQILGTFGKKQGGQHIVKSQWTSQSAQLSSSLPRLVLHCSAPSRSWIPSLWQSTLTPAKTRQASGPASNTLNNTTEMTVSTLAKTELAFKSAKFFWWVMNVSLCFSLLESLSSDGDKAGYDNAQPQMSINDLCLRDCRSLSWGITCSNQSILTANLEVHTHCCSKAQQVLLRSVFR